MRIGQRKGRIKRAESPGAGFCFTHAGSGAGAEVSAVIFCYYKTTSQGSCHPSSHCSFPGFPNSLPGPAQLCLLWWPLGAKDLLCLRAAGADCKEGNWPCDRGLEDVTGIKNGNAGAASAEPGGAPKRHYKAKAGWKSSSPFLQKNQASCPLCQPVLSLDHLWTAWFTMDS